MEAHSGAKMAIWRLTLEPGSLILEQWRRLTLEPWRLTLEPWRLTLELLRLTLGLWRLTLEPWMLLLILEQWILIWR